MRVLFSFLFMALFMAACSKPADDQQVNVADLNKKFINAWNNQQADSVIALLADDAQFLQGETHYKTKAEVTENWVKKTMGTITNLKTNVVSSGIDTKIAYEAGTFSVDVPARGPEEPNAFGEGNFMLLWKKAADGKWKLSYAQLEDHPLQVKQ